MLEFDEYTQLLVANPFADDSSISSNKNDILRVTLTLNSSAEHHPLRSQSVSPARCNTPDIPPITVVDSEGETGPRLTPLLSVDGSSAEVTVKENRTASSAGEAPRDGSDTIVHLVDPNDSFASVALRYGVSIAAIRRANQLWPSDPVHLRTELLIPRGDTLRTRQKPTHGTGTDTPLRSVVKPTPDLSSDFVTSSFAAARNMILSALPARISLDSLSSRASTSEDHELDDLQTVRAHKMLAVEAPFAQDGHELSILGAPHTRYKLSGAVVSSRDPVSFINNQHADLNHISPIRNLHSRSISLLPSVSLERLPRRQPFGISPVRTSQLAPEPAMELPVRRPCI